MRRQLAARAGLIAENLSAMVTSSLGTERPQAFDPKPGRYAGKTLWYQAAQKMRRARL